MPVLMFQEQFAEKVLNGTKRRTIRPRRKRPIKIGDQLSLRKWSGKPYGSPQIILREAVCLGSSDVLIERNSVLLGGLQLLQGTVCDRFAQADGFKDFDEMIEWFTRTHTLPFNGTLITW